MLGILKRLWSDAAEAAAEQRLDKSPKIQTALEAVFLRDLADLSEKERRRVDDAWEKKMRLGGKQDRKATSHSDIVVTDKMEVNTTTTSSPGALTVAALGVLTAGAVALWWPGALDNLKGILPGTAKEPDVVVQPKVIAPTVQVDDLELKVRWYVDEDGQLRTEVLEQNGEQAE